MCKEDLSPSGRRPFPDRPAAKWAAAALCCALFWWFPSSGLADALCVGLGLWGLSRPARFRAVWLRPAGLAFAALGLFTLASALWSVSPRGTLSDIGKFLPLLFGFLGLPLLVTSRRRFWNGALLSAGAVTLRFVPELVRLYREVPRLPADILQGAQPGFRTFLRLARLVGNALYSHPNAASLLACLCAVLFAAYLLSGRGGRTVRGLCAAGILVDLAYLLVLGSRGPQAVLAMTVLLAPVLLLPWPRAKIAYVLLVLAGAYGLWCAWIRADEVTFMADSAPKARREAAEKVELWRTAELSPEEIEKWTDALSAELLQKNHRVWQSRVPLYSPTVGQAVLWPVERLNPRFADRSMSNLSDRKTVWRHTSRLIREDRPVLGFGFGKKAFKKAYYENTDRRAPKLRTGIVFPHAHSYWRMAWFQGGACGLALALLAWGAAFCAAFRRLFLERYRRGVAGETPGKALRRSLPAATAVALVFSLLLYGIWDFPDSVARQAQFLLLGVLMAFSAFPVVRPGEDSRED